MFSIDFDVAVVLVSRSVQSPGAFSVCQAYKPDWQGWVSHWNNFELWMPPWLPQKKIPYHLPKKLSLVKSYNLFT